MEQILPLVLRPHIERGGYHADRFDAYLGDELISTHRSGWHTPARELLRRGWPPGTLMRVQHAGRPFDPTIVPKPIGEIAKWYVTDTDDRGTRRVRWVPPPDDLLGTMYPDLWMEPSRWPWDTPSGGIFDARTGADEAAAGDASDRADAREPNLTSQVMRARAKEAA
jgi:hypothetical protein